MATDPYAAFADPVADPYAAFADTVAAPVNPKMAIRDFGLEALKRLRAGETPEQIRAFAETVRSPDDPTGRVRYTLGEDFDKTAHDIAAGDRRPVRVVDGTEGSKLGAGLRGAADAVSFNSADEIEAGLRSAFSPEDYDTVVGSLRAQRAIDAQVNPNERLLGQALGTIGSAAVALPAKLFQGASLLGTAGRSAATTSAMSGLSAYGAAQSNEEGLARAPAAMAEGALLGAALPLGVAGTKMVGGMVQRAVHPRLGAEAALRDAEIDIDAVRTLAEDFRATQGREPRLAEILTSEEASRLTQAISLSRQAQTKARQAFVDSAEELGPNIVNRVTHGDPPAPRDMGTIRPAMDGITAEGRGAIGVTGRGIQVQAGGRAVALPGKEVGDARTVIDGGTLYGTADTARTPFERAAIQMPATEIGRIETPGSLRQKAKKFGNIAWGQFEDIPFNMSATDRAYFDEYILPYVSLNRLARDDFMRNYASGNLTIGDMDIIRKSLGKSANSGAIGSEKHGVLKDDVMAMMSKAVPETREAVSTFAGLMQAADGAELGIKAARPDTSLIKFIDDLMETKDAARRGVAPGARASVIEQGLGNPLKAYKFARELSEDSSFAKRFAAGVGEGEATRLAKYADQQRRGIDSLAALAKIPEKKVESQLQTTEGLLDLVAAGTFNVGGAFKSGIIGGLVARARPGRWQADRLAEMLLDPRRRNEALKAIAGLDAADGTRKLGGIVKDIVRDSFMRAVAEIGKDNTEMPEGYIGVGTEDPQNP